MNTDTTAQRYSCKTCGAQSPDGIGYADNSPSYPAPAADCAGFHYGDEVAF